MLGKRGIFGQLLGHTRNQQVVDYPDGVAFKFDHSMHVHHTVVFGEMRAGAQLHGVYRGNLFQPVQAFGLVDISSVDDYINPIKGC